MVKSNKTFRRWSEAEDKVLKELWHNHKVTKEMLVEIFPDRTLMAIIKRASGKGYKTFNEIRRQGVDEEALLRIRKLVQL